MTDLAGAAWKKSIRSANSNNCVEVATNLGVVGLRDSKNPHGPALTLAPTAFDSFLTALKRGTFDVPA